MVQIIFTFQDQTKVKALYSFIIDADALIIAVAKLSSAHDVYKRIRNEI